MQTLHNNFFFFHLFPILIWKTTSCIADLTNDVYMSGHVHIIFRWGFQPRQTVAEKFFNVSVYVFIKLRNFSQ